MSVYHPVKQLSPNTQIKWTRNMSKKYAHRTQVELTSAANISPNHEDRSQQAVFQLKTKCCAVPLSLNPKCLVTRVAL